MAELIYGTLPSSGYGYGYGSGYGYGYGSGDGSGDGSGSGSGYGYGDGDGDKPYWEAAIAQSVSDAEGRKKAGQVLAFWRSAKDGSPCNSGTGGPRSVGMIEEVSGPVRACSARALHATMKPSAWKGERLWIVALYPPVIEVDDNKLASGKREILAEVPNWFL
jgi:hypothetical protein